MLQAITNTYHNHSDRTITPESVHSFGINITPSSLDLDDHSWWTLKHCCRNCSKKIFNTLSFLFWL